jgi:hypothetical protein
MLILLLVRTRKSWMTQAIRDKYPALLGGDAGPREVGSNGEYPNRNRRRIEGLYHDDPTLENNPAEEPAADSEPITDLNHNGNPGQANQGPIMQPSRVMEGNNAW